MTEISYTNELLDRSRNIQDELADQVIAFYFPSHKKELANLLLEVSDNGYEPGETVADSFRNLWQHVFRNEDLTDRESLKKGQ